jgi:hypothetical protein
MINKIDKERRHSMNAAPIKHAVSSSENEKKIQKNTKTSPFNA